MDNKKKALFLIVMFGLVSLFGDITYEGARSVNGPYLAELGANAALVGLIAGGGEFVGYAVRILSGVFADKTGAYWFFTFLGYGLLVSVPMLALTGIWQIAALLMIFERLGKALRAPAKDTLMSNAAKVIGTGKGFGIHEFLDQIGAILGPMIFALVFSMFSSKKSSLELYRLGYSLLWIPVILVILSIVAARIVVPNPEKLESSKIDERENLPKLFFNYTFFTFFLSAGFANFAILAYHFKVKHIIPESQIPLLYAIAMGVDAFVALLAGWLYDKIKLKTLYLLPLLTLPIPILAFQNTYIFAVLSVMLWGVVMGIHETIIKAAIADITPLKKRGTGYGIFNTVNGLAFFIGASLMGFLYELNILYVIIFVIIIEIAAIPWIFTFKENKV